MVTYGKPVLSRKAGEIFLKFEADQLHVADDDRFLCFIQHCKRFLDRLGKRVLIAAGCPGKGKGVGR